MKTLLALALFFIAALPITASAQLRFEGGQVSISGFTHHYYFDEPYDESYSWSYYFHETEVNFDLVFASDEFGIQAAGHLARITWPYPGRPTTEQFGTTLHGYYISPNQNKFGAYALYRDVLPSGASATSQFRFGVEAIVGIGPLDVELSFTPYTNSRIDSAYLATVEFFYPLNDFLEVSAGYSYRQYDTDSSMEWYSVGVDITPVNSPVSYQINYAFEKMPIPELGSDFIQFSVSYRFGSGNTGRFFSDKNSGIGRFWI